MQTMSEDVWSEIIQFMDLQTICSLVLTSSTYNRLFHREHIWNTLIQRDFEQELNQIDFQLSNETLSPIEIYKYLHATFRTFPYEFPPSDDNTREKPANNIITKVVILSTEYSIMSMLLMLFVDGIWDTSRSSIGQDFRILNLWPKKDGTDHRLHRVQWWVTVGPERYRTVTRSYYRGAHLVLTAFDIADPENTLTTGICNNTLADALHWANESDNNKESDVPIYLIGIGKSGNDYTSPHVSRQDVINYCKEHNYCYFEVKQETYLHDTIVILTQLHRLRMNSKLPDHQQTQSQTPSAKKQCIIN
jgi:GTPase SAR1 family protein